MGQKRSVLRRVLHRIRHEVMWQPVGKPRYDSEAPCAEGTCFKAPAGVGEWYPPAAVGASLVGERSCQPECARSVLEVMRKLEPDDYVRYLIGFYEAGLRGPLGWRYSDITTVLLAAAQMLRPRHYLEIGVRRGRSLAMVASVQQDCEIVGFDMWVENYGGMENPGPAFVRAELAKLGFRGKLELVNGNSHCTLKRYFREHPEAYFDLMTVDGDHSRRGASLDLRDVLPRLKVGGMIVFDDVAHPDTAYLARVWRRYVADDVRFSAWEFRDLGFGIALGVRRF